MKRIKRENGFFAKRITAAVCVCVCFLAAACGSGEPPKGKYSALISYEHPYGKYEKKYTVPDGYDRADYLYEKERFTILASTENGTEEILKEYPLEDGGWKSFPYSDREWDRLFYPGPLSFVPDELLDLSTKDGNNEARVLELSDEVFLIFKNKELYYCEFIQMDERETVPKAVRFFLRLQKKS